MCHAYGRDGKRKEKWPLPEEQPKSIPRLMPAAQTRTLQGRDSVTSCVSFTSICTPPSRSGPFDQENLHYSERSLPHAAEKSREILLEITQNPDAFLRILLEDHPFNISKTVTSSPVATCSHKTSIFG